MFPCRNSKDPGIFVLVYSDNGVNSPIDVVGLSIGLKSLIKDYEAPQCITEEYDLIRLEDDGHDRYRWHLAECGRRRKKAKPCKWLKMISHLDFHRVIGLHQYNHEARTRPCPIFDTSVLQSFHRQPRNHTPVVITDGNRPTGPSLRPE